jgi:ketosteroid isomerase-like protein
MIGALVVQHLFSTSGRAFEQRDTEALLSSWADDVVFEFGGAGGMSGHFAGKEAVRGWFHRWFERMDSLEMKVRHVGVARPWALGLSNTVLVEFVVDETSHDGVTVHTEGVTVYDVRHGKVVRARNYLFDEHSETTTWGESQIG